MQLNLNPVSTSLDGASSISITPSGLIYITETNKHRMLVLSADGSRIDSLGAQGSGDYRFDSPVSVDATNGLKIFIADHNNGRIQLFDRRFQYLSSITSEKIEHISRFRPSQVVVNNTSELFVYDADRHQIHMFDSNGNYSRDINLRQYNLGSDLQMKISDSVLLLFDYEKGVIHRFSGDGGYLNFIGGFNGAKSIHSSESNIWAIYVDRLVQYSRRGEPIQTYELNHNYSPKDLFIYKNSVFVLSSDQIFKADLQ